MNSLNLFGILKLNYYNIIYIILKMIKSRREEDKPLDKKIDGTGLPGDEGPRVAAGSVGRDEGRQAGQLRRS